MSRGFEPVALRPEEQALQAEVRAFLDQELPPGSYRPGLGMDAEHRPAFSRHLGERGWVGMAIPPRYGGAGRGPVDRFVVVEELLAAGAPVAAHWVADRQTAPTLLAYGSEAQKERFLPAIAAGECYFSIGMSEPDAGSDLAAVRTRAARADGGWVLSGTKVWTTNAHLNHFFVVLCRTSPPADDRHQGLSQLIVDLSSPGVQVNPITSLDGGHHFNEVVLDEVAVPDDMVLGEVGHGWRQVTSELSLERSGPDRFLSAWPLLVAALAEHPDLAAAPDVVGRLVARTWAIRQLSLSVARSIEAGVDPAVEAAMVKDLGTCFEQHMVGELGALADAEMDPTSTSTFRSLLARATLLAPSFTIRGGTTEILRTVAARGL